MSTKRSFTSRARKKAKALILRQLEPYHIQQLSKKEEQMLEQFREENSKHAAVYETTAREMADEAEEQKRLWTEELQWVTSWLEGYDRKHVWVFNSGNTGEDFRGNPKYLFAYINNYRPDIRAIWITSAQETVDQIKELGFCAVCSDSPAAAYVMKRIGVAVCEQVKISLPFDENVAILNLWHGVGQKLSERSRISDDDDMRLGLAKKYIMNNAVYQNQMIVCCANHLQIGYFLNDMGIDQSHFLHAGYARCVYQKKYKPIVSFNHDILGEKGLPQDTKIAVYAPTFRTQRGNTFSEAIPDLELLYKKCEDNGILLIFKMHPLMEKEEGFINAAQTLGDRPYFLFWDNKNDIYEILHKIDLLIYDYSSIFSDFLLSGVKNYIRYLFDSEDIVQAAAVNSEEDYYKYTYGKICKSFEDLLTALEDYEEDYDEASLEEILRQQWEYSDEDDLEKTIQYAMDFKVGRSVYPTLYSFDLFDTLFTRKGLAPRSIFYAVKEEMIASGRYPRGFCDMFPAARKLAESNVRTYMNKYQEQRGTFHTEIVISQIYDRIKEVYDLTDEQCNELMNWEIEKELESVVPLPEQIATVRKLMAEKENVILISDMYLPKEIILRMLEKADPELARLPLFLSNEYGVLKSNRLLYFEVYRSFKPYYNFGKWIHTGDNITADQNRARAMGIQTRLVKKPQYNDIEEDLISEFDNYNSFLLTGMQARMRMDNTFSRAEFVIDFVAPLLTAYVDWVVRDALEKGFEKLYFISRDGYPLKKIADALIQEHQWPIKTKYIYASRRTWRVPSYFDEIDMDYWADYGGNFNDIRSKEKFLHAASFEDEETFARIFPQIDLDSIDFLDWSEGQPARRLAAVMKESDQYREYLLSYAAQKRELVCGYLKQEVDSKEKHAFVEFWGRGYNQTCHSRLWNSVVGEECPMYYYYARTAEFTSGNCIRYNMTTNMGNLLFVEAVFANMPYRSLEEYEVRDGKIVPVLVPADYNEELYGAMERLLPEFAKNFAKLEFQSPKWNDIRIFDFYLDYYRDNKTEPFIYNNVGALIDAVAIYGKKREFAGPFTEEDITEFSEGVPRSKSTLSITMSYMRSTKEVQKLYDELYQTDVSGKIENNKLLKPEDIEENRKSRTMLEEQTAEAEKLSDLYSDAASTEEVRNRITLLTVGKNPGDGYYSLLRLLEGQSVYETEVISCVRLSEDQKAELAVRLARSRYVFSDGIITLISKVSFRPETSLLLINSGAFWLFRQGHDAETGLLWRKKYLDFQWTADYSCLERGADTTGPNILKAYALNEKNITWMNGCAITDVYFDEAFKENAVRKVRSFLNAAEDKKIILYLPGVRKSRDCDEWLELMDIDRLRELLGDRYCMAISIRANRKGFTYYNPVEIPGFCKAVKSGITLRELIVAADCIIGDYRDILFECALLKKRVFFTGFDYENRMKDKNNIYDFGEMCPFPLVTSEEELAEKTAEDSPYDFEPIEAFREKYLKYCDGKSAERIVQYMLEHQE